MSEDKKKIEHLEATVAVLAILISRKCGGGICPFFGDKDEHCDSFPSDEACANRIAEWAEDEARRRGK